MAASYATLADLHDHGLPRGVIVEPARVVDAVDATSNRLTLEAHGLVLDQAVQFRAGDGGALPGGLSASAVYYARPVSGSESLLEVSATAGGAALDITSAGTAPVLLIVALGPTIAASIEYCSRLVDKQLVQHDVPFAEPYPVEVVAITAKLAGAELCRRLGISIPSVSESDAIARADLKTFAKGVPLRDAAAPTARNRAAFYPMVSQRDDGTGVIP